MSDAWANLRLSLVLKNIYKVLKIGGTAVITVPCFEFLHGSHDVSIGHKRRYDKKKFERLLEKCGFHITHSRYYSGLQFLPYLLIEKMLTRFYKGKSKLEPKIIGLLDFIWLDIKLNLPFGTGMFLS